MFSKLATTGDVVGFHVNVGFADGDFLSGTVQVNWNA